MIYTPNTNQYATMGESAEIPLTDEGNSGKIEREIRQIVQDPKTGKIIDNVSNSAPALNSKYTTRIRQDMKGKNFTYPCVDLPYTEWESVSGAIGTDYKKYEGKRWASKKMNNKTYYFENRRYGDINIYFVTDDVLFEGDDDE